MQESGRERNAWGNETNEGRNERNEGGIETNAEQEKYRVKDTKRKKVRKEEKQGTRRKDLRKILKVRMSSKRIQQAEDC